MFSTWSEKCVQFLHRSEVKLVRLIQAPRKRVESLTVLAQELST